jgi:hypothetical protein
MRIEQLHKPLSEISGLAGPETGLLRIYGAHHLGTVTKIYLSRSRFETITLDGRDAVGTYTSPDFSYRGPPPKRVKKAMTSCSATTNQKILKIFGYTLRGDRSFKYES